MRTLGGRYEVLSEFEGGMGRVYKVRDRILNETVAAKTFKHLSKLDEVFFRETSTWLRLPAHTNIIRALYAMPIGRMPFLFVEYAQQGSFAKLIEQPDYDVLPRYLLDVCHGLEFLHDLGILHLDLKPENVLLIERDGHTRAAVSDFGLAYSRLDQDRRNLGGTLYYMAPERLSRPSRLEPAADIYSFGVMCYQLASGRFPFEARNRHELVQKHKFADPQPIETEGHAFRERLGELALKCLRKAPSNRYLSFGEIARELKGFVVSELPSEIRQELPRYSMAFRDFVMHQKHPNPEKQAEEQEKERALYNVGVCYYNLRDFQRAFEAFTKALEIGWCGESVYYIARILAHEGRIDEAIDICDQLIASPIFAQSGVREANAKWQATFLKSTLLKGKDVGKTEFMTAFMENFEAARKAAVEILAGYYEVDPSFFPIECISANDEKLWTDEPITTAGHRYYRCRMVIPGAPARSLLRSLLLYIYDGRKWFHGEKLGELDMDSLKTDLALSRRITEVLYGSGSTSERLIMEGFGKTHAVRITSISGESLSSSR